MGEFLLAIDQGTTGSTVLVVRGDGRVVARANTEFPQHFPALGQVEHDPEDIWSSVLTSSLRAMALAEITSADIAAIGVTNQRETTVLWERSTGKPIHHAIVWQDRRTAGICSALKSRGLERRVRQLTGLVLDPYFSGTKVSFILDAVAGARERAKKGELAFGTVESFLVHRLSGEHVTDATNASRTLLMDLRALDWSAEMLDLFDVPEQVLPRLVGSCEIVGQTRGVSGLRDGIPIVGLAGDQQSALFGQTCFQRGDVKCTYGTGAFVLLNTGLEPVHSQHGLLATVAMQRTRVEPATYALEGSAFVAGAAVQWLRDGLEIIRDASEIETLARSVPSSDEVYFVPALVGLGAPHWDPLARGTISGLTRATTRAHLARATLEGIAHQVADLVQAMASEVVDPLSGTGERVQRLRVDGGASRNTLLLELQSAFSDVRVERPVEIETTARGAAMLCALGMGWVKSQSELESWSAPDYVISPQDALERLNLAEVGAARAGWARAVARARL